VGGVRGVGPPPPSASISEFYRVPFSRNDIADIFLSIDARLTASGAARGHLPAGCRVAGWVGGRVAGCGGTAGRAPPPPASISESYRVAFSLNDISGILLNTNASLTASGAVRGRLPTGCGAVGWGGRRGAGWGCPGGRAASSTAARWRGGGVCGGGPSPPRPPDGGVGGTRGGGPLLCRPLGGGVSACHALRGYIFVYGLPASPHCGFSEPARVLLVSILPQNRIK